MHPIDLVDDPRLAAAGMMVSVAKMDGDVTAAQMDAVKLESRATFRVDDKEAADIVAYGRWLAGQSQDPDEALRRLTKVLGRIADKSARRDVVEMMNRIAAIEGGAASEPQKRAIERSIRGLDIV